MRRIFNGVVFVLTAACGSNSQGMTDGGPDAIATDPTEAGTCTTLQADVVYAGSSHVCAKKSDGSLLCWGINTSGQVGDGTTDGEPCLGLTQSCRMTPVQTKISDVATVAPGDHYTCVRKNDGTLWCFGTNGYGELGDGTTGGPECSGRCRTAPKQVAIGTVISASAAQDHACAVKSDGTVWCWGVNGSGELGDGTITGQPCGGLQCRPSPVQVVGLTDVAEVSAGYVHSCARKNDGTVWCWGDNNNGAIGDGTMGSPYKSKAAQASITGVAQISVGDSFTCARKSDGTMWCWGKGQEGALGTGSFDDQPLPVQVTALGSNVVSISAGRAFVCARKSDGTAWCWGRAGTGQLGTGKTLASGCSGSCEPVPAQVALGMDVADVSAGGDFACGRKKDGTVVCWGNQLTGELGIGHAPYPRMSCPGAFCQAAPVPPCLY